MDMNKLAGAMQPGKGTATRAAEKELARMPKGGHPNNDKAAGHGSSKSADRGGMSGGVGNNAGLGDAIRHLGKHHNDKGGAYVVGKHKMG